MGQILHGSAKTTHAVRNAIQRSKATIAERADGHAVEEYRAQGYEVAFSDRSPRGYRVVYMDTMRDLPGMIELMEMKDSLEARYTEMYLASVGWDGLDPTRRAK